MDWTTLFTCVTSSLTTIVVAALGLYQSKKTKEAEEYRKLREKLDEKKHKELTKEKEEEEKRFQELEASVNAMQKDVRDLKDGMKILTTTNLQNIADQLSRLHTLQVGNLTCVESLSNVVLVIGETLDGSSVVNNSDKDRLSKSIERHHEVEEKVRKDLYNIIV